MICEGFLFCGPANAMFIIQESGVVMFLSTSLFVIVKSIFLKVIANNVIRRNFTICSKFSIVFLSEWNILYF